MEKIHLSSTSDSPPPPKKTPIQNTGMLSTISSSRATTTTTTTTAALGFLSQTLIPIFRHFSSTSHRKRSGESSDEASEDDLGAFVVDRDRNGPPKLFVVQPRLRPEPLLQAKLSEALNLAESLEDRRDGDGGCGGEEDGEWRLPPHLVVQNPMARSRGSADKFFGPGTVENVKCHLQAIDSEDGPDGIFVNAILSGVQQRNLENAWGKPVLDRIGLIIEIFNAHAQTKEAKLQSELAALMYKSTRLVRVRGPSGRLTFGTSGEAEVVSAKGKGSGGRGFLSGAGESEIQLQRRRIQERHEQLLCEIEEVRQTRALQRYARKRRGGTLGQGLATIAVVGYTNAGKSTLVSALSRSDLYRDNRLFATVDPRLRNVILPSGRKALLSDTVGFISDLPLQLVEAFHATLEEVVDADLLVHVLDSSAKDLDNQRSTVLEVLKQIGVSDEKIQNMIEVWNKIDLLDRESGDFGTQEQGEGSNDGTVGGGFTNTDDNLLQQSPRMHGAEDGLINEITSDDDFSEIGFPGGDENEKVVSHCGHKKEEDVDIHVKLMGGAGFRSFPSAPTQDLDAEDYEEVVNYQEHDDDMESQLSENSTDDNDPSLPLLSERPPVSPLKTCKPKDDQCVKTSAVEGVGLQELLHLIDLKLSNGKSLEKENTTEIFDRKWRPSHGNVGKVGAVR